MIVLRLLHRFYHVKSAYEVRLGQSAKSRIEREQFIPYPLLLATHHSHTVIRMGAALAMRIFDKKCAQVDRKWG